MSGVEIIAGILLILASLVIILIVLVQESKEQGLTSAIEAAQMILFTERIQAEPVTQSFQSLLKLPQ